MAAIASITVKKADGTTNIVWASVTGAAGNSSALWRSTTATGTVGQQPALSVSARSNQAGTVRRIDGKVSFPSVYTETTTSLTKVRSTMILQFTASVPQDVAATDLSEFAAQATNLLVDTMVRGSITSGFAPT